MAVGMFGIILLPFVFTLLVILLIKVPKVGAVLVGTILFLVLAGRFLAFRGGVGMPGFMEVVIVAPFAFVLLVLMFSKAPKAAAGVIVAILVAVLAGLVFLIPMHRRVAVAPLIESRMSTGQVPSPPEMPVLPQPAIASPIWSEGVEDEYEADVYPSKQAAVRAMVPRLQAWAQQVVEDANQPREIVLFQGTEDRSVLWGFERALEQAFSGIPCSIETGFREIDPNEIGIILRSSGTSGSVTALAAYRQQETSVVQDFVDKAWVEDFAGFANARPNSHFLVARSWQTCTSENEAKEQAIQDACARLKAFVAQTTPVLPGQTALQVDRGELEAGGFVADQFVQSFDGMAGRLWRQAILIDASAEKLAWLQARKDADVHVERITWARMILSALGVLVVILATYLFLNMATRGYYVWSLRIAGTVLAIAGIVSIILVLR